jgi:hypothetical protein
VTASAPLSAPVAGVPLSLSERVRTAPTPHRLRSFQYLVWGIAGLLFLLGEGSLAGALQAMQTVGKDTAPSIIDAQEIGSALADLDANAGNYLLGNPQHQGEATKAFEEKRLVVTKSLVDAAKNITYKEEYRPINDMVDGFGRYLELYGQMRFRKDSGDAAGAFGAYTSASELMHKTLLPAATTLDDLNYAALKREYERQGVRSVGAGYVAGLVAAALVAALGYCQVFLFRKTRRVFNLPLLVATLVAALTGIYLVQRITVSREDLRVAKEDAFESIHALWQARTLAYDANGDETRYLLAGLRAPQFEAAYKTKVQKLASLPQPDERILGATKPLREYTGYFAAELGNITFAGEREAAVRMVRAFAAYDKIDGQMRKLEQGGKHAEAVQLCIGSGANESNAAFDRFDQALRDVIAINHREFDSVVEDGMRTLSTARTLLPIASLLVVFLTLFGIRPRLREYAA